MISVKDLKKEYRNGEIVTKVLRGIDLEVNNGEFLAIMGKSGAGKSTLLYQIGLLDMPTSGKIIVDGVDIQSLSENEKTNFRLRKMGYVFQDYALVPELSAVENIALPLMMSGTEQSVATGYARELMDRIGMSEKYNNRPNQLSGGEQQRVSIARSIIQSPQILFADEPTANLDSTSSRIVIELLSELHRSGQTIVMVTHEEEYAANCDKIIYIDDGKISN